MQPICDQEVSTQQRLDAAFRMQLALKHIGCVDETRQKLMLAWLQQMMFPTVNSAGPDGLQATITPDRQQITWSVLGQSRLLVPGQHQLMMSNQLPKTESTLLGEMANCFSRSLFSTWLQVSATAQRAGWFFSGDIPFSKVVAFLPAHEDSQRFLRWMQSNNLSSCHLVRRATGLSNQILELRLPLIGHDIQSQVLLGLDLFDTLGVELLPERALTAFLHVQEGPLFLSISLSAAGVVKLALGAKTMPQSWLFELCQLSGFKCEDDYEKLAAVQGTLGVDEPSYIESQQSGQGVQIALHYELLNL